MVPPKCALAENTKLADAIQNDYTKILRWARKITKNDHHAAEDLVQDLALKSLQMAPGSIDVSNVDGYVYRSLMNAHISQCRIQARRMESQFDSEALIDLKQLTTDPRDLLLIQEQLAEICHFATVRKDSSISASILLLRYFHGYFTAEVVKLLKRPRNAIESRLAKARLEVLDSITNSVSPDSSLNFNLARTKQQISPEIGGFLQDLRQLIFSRRAGRCLTSDQYRRIYTKPHLTPTREEVAHIVCCESCLEHLNNLLKIPSLRDRHPLDTRGPESAFDFFDHHRTKTAAGFTMAASR